MEKLVIDGVPISENGIYLAENSYKSVLQYPKLKAVDSNDWAEYDGIEPDLTDPTLDVRSITLNFYAKGVCEYEKFITSLLKSEYRIFYFPELGIERQWRLDSNSIEDYDEERQSFSLTFFDDDPNVTTGAETTQKWAKETEITIDNINLSNWGIHVLEGTWQDLVTIPQTKQRLFVNENSMNGAIYDAVGEPKTKERTATLHLFIRGDTVEHLMANYYGFLYFLVQPEQRELVLTRQYRVGNIMRTIYDTFLCYYQSQTVDEVILHELSSGLAGLTFDLNICITEHSNEVEEFLIDDGEEYFIVENNDVKLLIG